MDQEASPCKFLMLGMAASAIATAFPAAAAEKVTAVVSFADLNLATPEGREMLESRIVAAVADVCGRPSVRFGLHEDSVRACRADAFEDAMEKVEEHLVRLLPAIAAVD